MVILIETQFSENTYLELILRFNELKSIVQLLYQKNVTNRCCIWVCLRGHWLTLFLHRVL